MGYDEYFGIVSADIEYVAINGAKVGANVSTSGPPGACMKIRPKVTTDNMGIYVGWAWTTWNRSVWTVGPAVPDFEFAIPPFPGPGYPHFYCHLYACTDDPNEHGLDVCDMILDGWPAWLLGPCANIPPTRVEPPQPPPKDADTTFCRLRGLSARGVGCREGC